MIAYVLAFVIGIVAGLRAMTAPAVVSWAAKVGWLPLGGTWLAFLGYAWTPWILTLAAVGELINDKITTQSRTAPPPFIARLVMGALSGAAVAAPAGYLVGGIFAGVLGAAAGTFGGAKARSGLTKQPVATTCLLPC
jgi:uncharacterized membrane protein